MTKRLLLIGIILLLLLSFFLRFYQLGAIPLGLNKDETAIGYNAYSILQTGKDEHGVSWPLYFKSFNDFKLPGYMYMTAIAEYLFGVNAFAVRFSSAFFGFIGIISLYFLVKVLSKRNDLAIVSALFLAFNPWQFFFSRTGFEVNVATSLIITGSLFFVLAVKKKRNWMYALLSIIAFGIALYSYNVTRIFAPFLLFALAIIYRDNVKKWSRFTKILSGFGSLLVITPFILALWNESGLVDQTSGVFLNGLITQANHLEFRSYLINAPDIYAKLFFNSYMLIAWEYSKNIVKSFSTDFFFFASPKSVNGIANHGLFYPFEAVTIAFGLYSALKQRAAYMLYFSIWLAFGVLLISMTQEVPHPTRSFTQVVPLTVFSAFGALALWKFLDKLRHKKISIMARTLALLIIFYSGLTYFTSYFYMFPTDKAILWRSEEAALVAELQKYDSMYTKVIIDKKTDFAYTALAFYLKYDPNAYHKSTIYQPDGLLITAKTIGKYEFTEVDMEDLDTDPKTLYVITEDSYKEGAVVSKIYYPERPIVSVTDSGIISYPHKDTAYVLVAFKDKPISEDIVE